jgi:nucleolar complex protein 2
MLLLYGRLLQQVSPLMKSYLGNSLHLLSSMTQPAMTAFTLRRLRASAPFLGPFPHLAKKLMRSGLKLYGSEEAAPRLQV